MNNQFRSAIDCVEVELIKILNECEAGNYRRFEQILLLEQPVIFITYALNLDPEVAYERYALWKKEYTSEIP